MRSLLSAMHAARNEWTARGAERLPDAERTEWLLAYFSLLRQGYRELPPDTPVPKSRGRPKQHPAKNLLDALVTRAEQVLGFLEDGMLPFTNNEAERSLRVGKLHHKIAGTFRSDAGAQTFCVLRSYLDTLRKQGQSLFHALCQTFLGSPLPIAWGA